MGEFLDMGGYAAFVWPAFGVTILGLGALFWQSWRLARRREDELEALRARVRDRPDVPRPARVARREPQASDPVADLP